MKTKTQQLYSHAEMQKISTTYLQHTITVRLEWEPDVVYESLLYR